MLDSSIKMALTRSQSSFISCSDRCSHFISCAIHLSGSCMLCDGMIVAAILERMIESRRRAAKRRCHLSRAASHFYVRAESVCGTMLFRCILWLLLPAFASALHESEAGVVDWHKQNIGVPLPNSPKIHRTGPTKGYLLTATSSNVLAALNPANGNLG
jgi:hypothetical protein